MRGGGPYSQAYSRLRFRCITNPCYDQKGPENASLHLRYLLMGSVNQHSKQLRRNFARTTRERHGISSICGARANSLVAGPASPIWMLLLYRLTIFGSL